MSDWYTPAPPGTNVGPLPKRSAVGLALQFALQWLYLVPWIVFYEVCDLQYVGECVAEGSSKRHVLTLGRYRLERRGTQEDWEAWADQALDLGTRVTLRHEQDRRAGNAGGKKRYTHKEQVPTTFIKCRYYRGIGAAGVAALAARRGWDIDWKASTPDKQIRLVYRKPLDA
ncbi:hypothetical protein [Kitasatospora sp. McL0602]|uniref:hypothetical protein n=1 Tax=Kitasatospora sp. McL0602 TaxID=3439530 RepID=UPI003F88B966